MPGFVCKDCEKNENVTRSFSSLAALGYHQRMCHALSPGDVYIMVVPTMDRKHAPLGAYLYCKAVEVGMTKDLTLSRMVQIEHEEAIEKQTGAVLCRPCVPLELAKDEALKFSVLSSDIKLVDNDQSHALVSAFGLVGSKGYIKHCCQAASGRAGLDILNCLFIVDDEEEFRYKNFIDFQHD